MLWLKLNHVSKRGYWYVVKGPQGKLHGYVFHLLLILCCGYESPFQRRWCLNHAANICFPDCHNATLAIYYCGATVTHYKTMYQTYSLAQTFEHLTVWLTLLSLHFVLIKAFGNDTFRWVFILHWTHIFLSCIFQSLPSWHGTAFRIIRLLVFVIIQVLFKHLDSYHKGPSA